MAQEQWTQVDQYFSETLGNSDAALEAALESSRAAGLPSINVSPNQGKLLHILAKTIPAKKILEIGTLGGYSAIWLARALPASGKLITLEFEARHVEVANANLKRAGLSALVEIRHGAALDTLPIVAKEKLGPFDLVFIDADKANIPEYFNWAMKLTRPGSVIIVDNVVRKGAVVDAKSTDASVVGVRRLMEMLAAEKRVTSTVIQTVGSKGHDGFAIALVN